MDIITMLTPFLLIPVSYVWHTVNKNRDKVAILEAKVLQLQTNQTNSERTMERFIVNLEKSIEGQQQVTKEIHTLVSLLDKRMAVFETLIHKD